MARGTRLLAMVLAVAMVFAGCGDDNLSAEECDAERNKLLEGIDAEGNLDPEQIAEQFEQLEDKGCTDLTGSDGADESGSGSSPLGGISRECLQLSQEAAAKGVEAMGQAGNEDRLRQLNEELADINRRMREECPDVPTTGGGG